MRPAQPARGPVGWFFGKFNQGFTWFTRRYIGFVSFLTGAKLLVIGVFIAGLVATVFMYRAVPTGFIPEEDQGYFFVIAQAPDGVSLQYTSAIMDRVAKEVSVIPEVQATFLITGFGFDGGAANVGLGFVSLKSWKERTLETQSVYGLLNNLNKKLSGITEGRVLAVNAPPVSGLSATGGFEFLIQDRTGTAPIETLVENAQKLIAAANKRPELQRVFTQFTANTPQFDIQVNRNQAKALNVDVNQIFTTLIKVQGSPAPGASSGQAIAAMEEVATATLPQGFGYEWTGTYLQEKASGGATGLIFGIAIVIVFLVLAAQYESYTDPLIILLTVPLAILGAMTAIWIRSNIFMVDSLFPKVVDDIYCQVGLVTLIGLAAKNAILVVEFANQLTEQGMSYTRAAVKAGEERLRPILMTSFAALLGFLPLVLSEGAGASSRWSLGTALFGGLFLATFLSLFLVPILYILVKTLAAAGASKFFKNSHPQPEKTAIVKH